MNRIDAANSAEQPKLIAHRGLAADCPPNSLAAFRRAAENGFWAIETDIRKTADGRYVCIHDPVVDGMFDGSGAVSEQSFAALRRLSYGGAWKERGSAFGPMPSLEEYLEICAGAGCHPFIETKTDDVPGVLEIAFRYFPEEAVVLSSIEYAHIQSAAKFSQSVFLHHIFSDVQTMQALSGRGYCGVSYNYKDWRAAPQALLSQTHDSGVCFCLRAADTPEDFRAALALGADYVPTNCVLPEQVRALRRTPDGTQIRSIQKH